MNITLETKSGRTESYVVFADGEKFAVITADDKDGQWILDTPSDATFLLADFKSAVDAAALYAEAENLRANGEKLQNLLDAERRQPPPYDGEPNAHVGVKYGLGATDKIVSMRVQCNNVDLSFDLGEDGKLRQL